MEENKSLTRFYNRKYHYTNDKIKELCWFKGQIKKKRKNNIRKNFGFGDPSQELFGKYINKGYILTLFNCENDEEI